MVKPTRSDLQSESSFFTFVKNGQKYDSVTGAKSTASINGGQTYAATTHTVADILQGNLLGVNPQDQMLVLNKALTNSLEGIYKTTESVHGYSTFTNTLPNVSSGGSGGVSLPGSVTDGSIGATIEERIALQLPVVHPNGALIWMRTGKASSEMHLPVGTTYELDKSTHQQYSGLAPDRRHPYNMDRVGGWIGGEDFTPGDVNTGTIGGESAETPGQPGAFGVLDPLSEKFYISMAWPYRGDVPAAFRDAGLEDVAQKAEGLKKDEHYKGKRILVYSKQTSRAVVCTPGDWGPLPKWSNGTGSKSSIFGFCAGLSPDVHFALGTTHGAEVILGWMPDDTPLGPYGTTGFNPLQTVSNFTAAIGTLATNTFEELTYAGNLIASHPNLIGDRFKADLRNGLSPQVGNHLLTVFFKDKNKGTYYPSLLNYLWYALQAGFKIRIDGSGYVHRTVNFEPGARMSIHSYGGAVDIMAIGRGEAIPYTHARWRAENDTLWQIMANLPRDTKPAEVGSSFAATYGWFNVYKEENDTHIHFGFKSDQVGSLISALKSTTSTPSGIRGVS